MSDLQEKAGANTALVAYAILTLTTMMWGANSVAGRLATGHISPGMLTLLRWAGAFLILLLVSWPRLKADWPKLRRAMPHLMMLGAMGFAIFNIFLYTALNYTTAVNGAIAQAGIPVVVFLFNFLIYRLKPSALQVIGLLLGITGVALVAVRGNPSNIATLSVNFGDALLIGALIAYGGYTVALRSKPESLHWQSTMTGMSFGAFLISIPYAVWEYSADRLVMPDTIGWGIVAFAIIFPSILSQSLYIRGNELIGGNRAGLFINLVPIWGTILAILVLGETFAIWQAVALGLTLGGITLAERFKPKAQ